MISLVRLAASFMVALLSIAGQRQQEERWTPDRVREFVLKAHLDIEKFSGELLLPRVTGKERQETMGTCFGDQPAFALAKTTVVLPRLRQYVTGRALQCYLSTYFGCTIGQWVASAGIALEGAPAMVPFTRSKVTILEQRLDRVVADVVEADRDDVNTHGVLRRPEPELFDPNEPNRKYSKEELRAIQASRDYSEAEIAEYTEKSRYTLSRDAAGVWRISDRRPTWQWECRPR
jgi:hypothetical protein